MKRGSVGKDILYPELSYDVTGVLFEVFKELGSGHKEKYYENAVAAGLTAKGIPFERQLYYPLTFKEKVIGKYFLDFLIDKKIVLELKKGNMYSSHKHIEQVLTYLRGHGLQLEFSLSLLKKVLSIKESSTLYNRGALFVFSYPSS